MRLQSKTAFITGGTSGIGFATAQAFILQGAFVGITGRDGERVNAAVSGLGNMCAGFVADAADDEVMAAALLGTARHSGRIDIVFANAGHYVHIPLGQASRVALEEQLRVVANVFMTVQLALPYLSERASIILMGSTYATMGPPGAGVYAASKAAVSALGRSMASELSPRGIRVNVVVPGAVYTPSWGMESLQPDLQEKHRKLIGERAPLNRMITAEEVANSVVFLASDESSGLQATEIVVDGGTTGASAGSPRFIRGEP